MHLFIRNLVTGNRPSPPLEHPLLHTSSNTAIHVQRTKTDIKRTSTPSQESGPLGLPLRLFTFHNGSLLAGKDKSIPTQQWSPKTNNAKALTDPSRHCLHVLGPAKSRPTSRRASLITASYMSIKSSIANCTLMGSLSPVWLSIFPLLTVCKPSLQSWGISVAIQLKMSDLGLQRVSRGKVDSQTGDKDLKPWP